MTDEQENIGFDQPDPGEASAGSEDARKQAVSATDEPNLTRVVYRRSDSPETTAASALVDISVWTRELAPAIIPLIVGFLLLLILIGVLGFLSVRRMDEVSRAALNLEQEHAAKLSLLLKLRLAVTRLNNEARARAEAEARGELKPPFEIRLNAARRQVDDLTPELARPPLDSDPVWNTFRVDLTTYIEVTRDLRRFSLEGFERFSVVDAALDGFLARSSQQQIEVFQKSEALQQAAARSIRNWTLIAFIFGALVAAGTIWEVQRRFGEMRRSVAEARRERSFTSQLLEGMVSAVVAIDEHDRIRSANAAFFRIFPRASIGASTYEKFAAGVPLKMLEAAISARVDQASYQGRWHCPRDADREQDQTFDVYSSPLAINGAPGQILTLVDVTAAAEAERSLRRQESLAAVGQATAQVAHEIRNPLGSIRLGVSMLHDSINDEEGLRTLELVERSIKHLSKLVVDVSQFSRRKALEKANVELHELLNHSLDLVADKINEKETTIETRLADEQPIGHWDYDQLSQAFVNLIANAIDASPKQATVSITTEVVRPLEAEEGNARNRARVTIADQGSGMDRATLDRVFEPFFSTKKRGTGLGLAIVKQIVEQHDGIITVASAPGEGTTFRIDLPV